MLESVWKISEGEYHQAILGGTSKRNAVGTPRESPEELLVDFLVESLKIFYRNARQGHGRLQSISKDAYLEKDVPIVAQRAQFVIRGLPGH